MSHDPLEILSEQEKFFLIIISKGVEKRLIDSLMIASILVVSICIWYRTIHYVSRLVRSRLYCRLCLS